MITTLQTSTIGRADDQNATGRRIVFLHGLFGRGKNFAGIAKALESEAQSLLVDLPNHGRSEWTERVSYIQMADSVAANLREGFASAGPVDIVGHSMGGKVAMVLALRHPDLVRRLVIIDISPTAAEGTGEFQHLLDSLTTLDLPEVTSRTQADAELQDLIPIDGTRGFLLQNLARTDNGFAWEPNLHLLRAELGMIVGFPEIDDARFEGPVLWIGGSESDYITDADEPQMRAFFPNVTRMTIDGAGHWVHAEKPTETVAALREFLVQSEPS